MAVTLPVDDKQNDFQSFLKEYFNSILGVICFSKRWSDPVMWSHYADEHRGIALGFDINDEHAYCVRYEQERLARSYSFTDEIPSEEFIIESITTKFKSWEYEQEVRMMVKLETECNRVWIPKEEKDVFFFTFCDELILKEVILGPCCDKNIVDIRDIVDDSVNVIAAELSDTEFQVRDKKL